MENNTVDYKAIGKRIKILRIHHSMTQDKLAELTGLSNQHISNIENGNTKSSLPTIIKIANSLSVTVDELLCDNIDNAKLAFSKNISFLLEDCTDYEVRVLSDMLLGAKQALRNNVSYRDIEK